MGEAAPGLRSRFDSFFSSRFCSFSSCFVIFSTGVEAAAGEAVDAALSAGDSLGTLKPCPFHPPFDCEASGVSATEGEGIGSILRGLYLCI